MCCTKEHVVYIVRTVHTAHIHIVSLTFWRAFYFLLRTAIGEDVDIYAVLLMVDVDIYARADNA